MDMPAFHHHNSILNTKEDKFVLCHISEDAVVYKVIKDKGQGLRPKTYSTASFSEKKVEQKTNDGSFGMNIVTKTICCCFKKTVKTEDNSNLGYMALRNGK